MTVRDLEAAIDAAVERIGRTAGEAVQRAGVAPDAIETLILTGGSTHLPLVRRTLDALFPSASFVRTDAFGSVGLGLAIDAGRRFG
jgi:hypothetical chaperone protein